MNGQTESNHFIKFALLLKMPGNDVIDDILAVLDEWTVCSVSSTEFAPIGSVQVSHKLTPAAKIIGIAMVLPGERHR